MIIHRHAASSFPCGHSVWHSSSSSLVQKYWRFEAPLPLYPVYTSVRMFAKRRESRLLANERLVATIVQQRRVSSPDSVQVRMLMEESPGASATAEVVTLSKAIQTSVELHKDLVGIALDQELPVVKVADLKALEYKQTKKTKSSQALPEKEIRFRAGIAENDMNRKVENMISYLEKGHKCLVNVRCRRRDLQKDPNAAGNMVNRILELVEEVAEPTKPPTFNPTNTMARLTLQPAFSKKKKSS